MLEIWRLVDPTTSINPNLMKNPNLIEDEFFHSHYVILQEMEKLPVNARTRKYMKATTIMAKLSSVTALMDYSKRRNVYIGLTSSHIRMIENKVKELNSSVRKFAKHRTIALRKWKNDNILTPADTLKYGNSDFVIRLVKLLNAVGESQSIKITRYEAIHVRDHIMYMMALMNAARTSNLMNITLEDLNQAEENKEFDCFQIRNSVYKTSLLYGDKVR